MVISQANQVLEASTMLGGPFFQRRLAAQMMEPHDQVTTGKELVYHFIFCRKFAGFSSRKRKKRKPLIKTKPLCISIPYFFFGFKL